MPTDTNKRYINFLQSECELQRRAHCLKLRKFSLLDGDYYLYSDLDHWFSDIRNKQLRVPMISASKGTSIIGKALDATAMIYDSPATRHVATNDAGYQAVLEECSADDVARGLDRALLLYEDVLIVPRIVDDELRLDLVAPDAFAAIAMVDDPRTVEAIAVEIPLPPNATADDPRWRIYTKLETYAINTKGDVCGAIGPNPLGEAWQVLLCSAQPSSVRGTLLATNPSADLLAAETAQMLLTAFALKESKSNLQTLVVTGDTSSTAMGQQADTESALFLGEGVSASVLNRETDLNQYTDLRTTIVDDCLSGRGIAPGVARLADASSGAAQWARRAPLVEKRKQRIPLLRRIERKLWTLVARVLDVVGDDRAYAMTGWAIDFVEPSEPLSRMEALQVFREERALFLKSTVDEIDERNPDLGIEGAIEELRSIVEAETARVGLTQALQAMNGGASSTVDTPTAEQNGRNGVTDAR